MSVRPALRAECECEPEHSIAKLGHCLSCPHYSIHQPTQIDYALNPCALRDTHQDGTPHNFEWASYNDDLVSTGACRCGLQEINFDMARLP